MTWREVIILQVLHASGFVDISDNEIDKIKEKATSKSTKDVANFRVKLFQDLHVYCIR